MFKNSSRVLVVFFSLLPIFVPYVKADNPAPVASVSSSLLVVKVLGNEAQVRRVKGTVKLLAVGDRLEVGDRVITGANSSVEVLLGDGSLVRVSPKSDYQFSEFGHNPEAGAGAFRWAFGLTKGGMRAIVEKSENKKKIVKFKVSTPAGTMGVRGTEFMLFHNPLTKETTLYTLSGEVLFDKKNSAFSAKNVRSVRKGMMSSVREGESAASEPRGYKMDEVLQSVQSGSAGAPVEMAALFVGLDQGSNLVRKGVADSAFDMSRLLKQVEETSQSFAEAQDYLAGYQSFENEKVAAVTEGLRRQGLLGSKKNEPLTNKSLDPARILSRERAEALVKDRIEKKAADLKQKHRAFGTADIPDEFDSTIQNLMKQVSAANKSGASAATCSHRQICVDKDFLGIKYGRSCHTAYVCDSDPPKPLSDYPVAKEYASELQGVQSPTKVQVESDVAFSPSTGGTPTTNTASKVPGTNQTSKSCCKIWYSCSDLIRKGYRSCAKGERGRFVEVCDNKLCKQFKSGAGSYNYVP